MEKLKKISELESIKKMHQDTRGVFVTLENVKMFMIFILILAVVAIALFVSLNSLTQESVIPRKTLSFNTFVNNSFKLNNSGLGSQNAPSTTANLTDVIYRDTVVINSTGGELITSTNYTISGSIFQATTGRYNNTNINVSSTYSYTIPSDATVLASNVTVGTSSFFTNVPTMFSILGAAAIIAVIVLILIAVQKFGGRTEGL